MSFTCDYDPDGWGATVDYRSRKQKPTKKFLFVHWVGPAVRGPASDGNINSEKAVLRAIERGHLDKGWEGAAYDWSVGQSGKSYEVRGHSQSAATSGDVDEDGFSNNVDGDAVLCIIGEGQEPSPEMLETLALIAADYDKVVCHKDAKGTKTACPGDDLAQWVVDLSGSAPVKSEPKSASKSPKKKTKPAQGNTEPSNWTEKIVKSLGTHRKGDRNDNIMVLQHMLNMRRQSLKVDGIFGPQTERAVDEFQTETRITVDGIVGPKTWERLLLG